MRANSTKDAQNYQKGCAHQKRLKGIFQAFCLSQIAQNNKYQDLRTKQKKDVLFRQEEKAYRKDTAYGHQPRASSFTKQAIRKEKGMTMTSIKRVILQLQSRLSACLTLDILGLRKTFLTKYHPYQTKREAKKTCLKRKKNTTRFTPEKG